MRLAGPRLFQRPPAPAFSTIHPTIRSLTRRIPANNVLVIRGAIPSAPSPYSSPDTRKKLDPEISRTPFKTQLKFLEPG
ncbi:MAG: hypothetical protein QW688_08540 [Thermoprotei archaeon]